MGKVGEGGISVRFLIEALGLLQGSHLCTQRYVCVWYSEVDFDAPRGKARLSKTRLACLAVGYAPMPISKGHHANIGLDLAAQFRIMMLGNASATAERGETTGQRDPFSETSKGPSLSWP